nr:Rz1-like lysis system protein LysC [Mesorhizobium sp. Root102]
MLTATSKLLCLALCAACTPTSPPILTKYVTVERHVPASFKRRCPARWHKPGGPETTGDFVERGDANEAALAVCSARMDKIIAWDKP